MEMRTKDIHSTMLVQDALSESNDGRFISDIELLQLHLSARAREAQIAEWHKMCEPCGRA